MKNKKINAFISKLAKSELVSKITGGSLNSQTAATESNGMNSIFNFNKKTTKDKIVLALGVVMILIVVAVLVYFLFFNKKKEEVSNDNKTLYDIAYETMGFKENTKLQKLYCSKKSSESGEQVNGVETVIYYFNDDEVETSIQHLDIKIKDEYMDYFDSMYKSYDESLTNDYKYDNVDTNLTKGDKELLTTVIIYNSKKVENKLSVANVTNYDDAKKTYVDAGFSCK